VIAHLPANARLIVLDESDGKSDWRRATVEKAQGGAASTGRLKGLRVQSKDCG
jgi:hypothetical protein